MNKLGARELRLMQLQLQNEAYDVSHELVCRLARIEDETLWAIRLNAVNFTSDLMGKS